MLKRSARHYAPVIEVIASASPTIWEIDAHAYNDEAIDTIMQTASQIRSALPEGASSILVTKIMLGVFGCVPAFDTNVKKGFGVATLGKKALKKVAEFYRDNHEIIDAHRVHTLDFASGKETTRKYTRAKVIDMVFFVEGFKGVSDLRKPPLGPAWSPGRQHCNLAGHHPHVLPSL